MKNLLIIAQVLFAFSSLSAPHPFNMSLLPSAQFVPKTETIEGATLGIWGENTVRGLSFNIVSGTLGDSRGLSIGAVNYSMDSFMGLQCGIVNYAVKLKGLQFGFVNIATTGDEAVQIGLVNIMFNNKKWLERLPSEMSPGMILVNWHF